ncbi:MAG: 2-succinyl-5-enolpyruvyl-6-hydroxy-3-cyclohexene-1-carboxylic-acid synthase [Acidimicrobiales bacterium]
MILPAGADVQAAFADIFVDEWARAGVTDAVVCPGSRSTPLLVALAAAAEKGVLRLHVLLDERSAGFFALGLGRASGLPAPVITTSGTAAAELHPAVIEASYAGAPMLAVTADRPAELQDCGAPQTVRQAGLFGPAVRWEVVLGVPELAAAGSWRSVASRSVAEARGGARRPGPVHLDLAFREPLVGSAGALLAPAEPSGLELGRRGQEGGEPWHRGREGGAPWHRGREGGAPWHRVAPPEEVPAPADVVELLAGGGERGLIVAGCGAGDPHAVWELSRATGWPVLADPTSGCRRPGAVSTADALLRTGLAGRWQPDVVVRLGAPWVSKVLNAWLGELSCPQVLVDRWGVWAAPDRAPGEVVLASPEPVCRAVAKAVAVAPSGGWAAQWARAEELAQEAIEQALVAEAAMTEPAIARALAASAPPGATVVVSSSMPVRDLECWARPRDALRVIANRGANGIDGVLSTALGVAAASRPAGGEAGGARPVIALLGDLALLHDAGALLGAPGRDVDLDVVVVDNDGGGIFNFLPQATSQPRERFERLWGTPHGLDLCALARGYGVPAKRADDLQELARALAGPEGDERAGRGVRVLVAPAARAENVSVHRRLHQAVDAAVSGLGAQL